MDVDPATLPEGAKFSKSDKGRKVVAGIFIVIFSFLTIIATLGVLFTPTSHQAGYVFIISGIVLIILSFRYGSKKSHYIVQNGKFVVGPSYYVRSSLTSAGVFGIFLFLMGIIAKILNVRGAAGLSYPILALFLVLSIFYFSLSKLPTKYLRKILFVLIGLTVIFIVKDIFLTGRVNFLGFVIIALFYFDLFKKVRRIERGPSVMMQEGKN